MERWTYRTAADISLGPRDRIFSVARETTLPGALVQFLSWTAIRLYLRIYHRFRTIGEFPADLQAPFVVIANHSSHLDALVLAASLPPRLRDQAILVAAGDVFFTSVPKAFLSTLLINCVPLWRRNAGPHAMKELRRRLVEGQTGLVIFPEGARTRDGRMLPFKPGLGMLVAGTATTVVPCRIRGAFRALTPEKGPPRPLPVRLLVGEPLRFDHVPNNREGWEEVVRACENGVRRMGAKRDRPRA